MRNNSLTQDITHKKSEELSDQEIIKLTRAEIEGVEQAKRGEIFGDWSDFGKKIFEPREEIEYIYPGLVPKGVEGGIFASGGTGKTFLCVQQVLYGAAGLPFLCFKPPRPLKCLFLCAEDQDKFLLERAENVLISDPELIRRLDLIKQNACIKSLNSQLTSFIKADNSGNYEFTEYFDQLKEELVSVENLDLIILDPLMSYWGQGENDAQSGQAIILGLRKIAEATGATVQVSHHVSKGSTIESIIQGGGRGTSAIYDGLRFAFGMVKILQYAKESKNELQKLRSAAQDDKAQFVKLFPAKSNHAKEINKPIILQRVENGILKEFDDSAAKRALFNDLITKVQEQNPLLSINQICKEQIGAPIRGYMKEKHGVSHAELRKMIEYLLGTGQLMTRKINNNSPGKSITVVEVVNS
jgi:hypothetical protein